MSDTDINKMNFKQLRNEVQLLRDELAIFKRRYEDAIYNLDGDNFGRNFTIEQNNMRSQIQMTAEKIKSTVSKKELETELEKYSTIEQTAEQIELTVNSEYVETLIDGKYVTNATFASQIKQSSDEILLSVSEKYENKEDAQEEYGRLSSYISSNKNTISAIVKGEYTGTLLDNYFTGIEISPNEIKMVDGQTYSAYNSDGLRFYDSANQREGWAIEPSSSGFGGLLTYYVNNTAAYRFGSGVRGSGYDSTDMVLSAINGRRGRFVVDVSGSTYPEVKFVGLASQSDTAPYIYANDKLLATQEWVLENAGSGGTVVAVFG